MVQGVSNEYIQNRFSQLPNVKKGEVHSVKKNESLWSIAQKRLGQNAKKSEISDYMFAIAKLNGLDTSRKMNNLRINQELYLPENFNPTTQTPQQAGQNQQAVQTVTPGNRPQQASVNPFNPNAVQEAPKSPMLFVTPEHRRVEIRPPRITPFEQTQTQRLPDIVTNLNQPANNTENTLPKNTQAEISFQHKCSQAMRSNLNVIPALTITNISDFQLYHVYAKGKKGEQGKYLMSFCINQKTNEISEIRFEDDNNIDAYGYDYSLKGNKIRGRMEYDKTEYGYVSTSDMAKLKEKLIANIPQK